MVTGGLSLPQIKCVASSIDLTSLNAAISL